MNRLEAVAALIDGAETALSASTEWSGIPVKTVGGNDQREAPFVLVDDTGNHARNLIGNRSDDGFATDESGNLIGERQRVMYSASPSLLAVNDHETESYRMINTLYRWFILAEKYPERIGPMVNAVTVGNPRSVDTDYRSADAVFVQSIPIKLRYEDTVTDDTVEPIDSFDNTFEETSNS